ncbi:MAG: 50S ribosomal protein L6 [Cytophagales bacterium]|jgi:large subunit ribosomal protein L6|nr:50S ribosomal protein L6 [Cytophagales bacterium]
MSRIGNLPVVLPEGVRVSVSKKNEKFFSVIVKKGIEELQQDICSCISIDVKEDKVFFSVNDTQTSLNRSAIHGLSRMLIYNMVVGVSVGFSQTLELVGVGYKAAKLGDNILDLDLGFSHKVYFVVPEGVAADVKAEKGKNLSITLKGSDKQAVGLVAAKIRKMRKADPYKGKGFRYANEVIKLKKGKTTTK